MTLSVAVVGCLHGELHLIQKAIQRHETETGRPIDVLFCCGDMQCVRSEADYDQMSIPKSKPRITQFVEYMAGNQIWPYLTIFIGGNHEASHILEELHFGGWVAPNFFYLGRSGVIRLWKGHAHFITVGGLSGIYKGYHYSKGYFETPPYNANTRRSVYHMRSFDVNLMSRYTDIVDVFLTHDWPQGITRFGDAASLVAQKRHFRGEVQTHTLGNQATAQLIKFLRIHHWFAGHLHAKFQAFVPSEFPGLPDMQFLALNKPRRLEDCIAFLDIPMRSTTFSDLGTESAESQDHSVAAEKVQVGFDLSWVALLHANYLNAPFHVTDHFIQRIDPPNQEIALRQFETFFQRYYPELNWDFAKSRLRFPWFNWHPRFLDLKIQRQFYLTSILDSQKDFLDPVSWGILSRRMYFMESSDCF